MLRRLSLMASAAAVLLGASTANHAGQPRSAEDLESVRDSFIFVFKDSVGADAVATTARTITREAGASPRFVYRTALKGFAAKMPRAAAEKLAAANPKIDYFTADGLVYASGQPGGGQTTAQVDQVIPYGITRVNGGTTPASGTAWVLDTGIETNHPDLNVDTARSANFITRGQNTFEDGNGHGTHVAGTIAAIDNSIGVVGVSPGSPVVAIRVLDNRGSGTISGLIAGIDYVAANFQAGDVANMSLTGGGFDPLDQAVINAANLGLKFALAAGNQSVDTNLISPARANHPNIWTVSAIDVNDSYASFSNFGNPPVDCAAPGVAVYSTYLNGGYATLSGTSMAAPHVTGILLLGAPTFSGSAQNDPDGQPDPICSH